MIVFFWFFQAAFFCQIDSREQLGAAIRAAVSEVDNFRLEYECDQDFLIARKDGVISKNKYSCLFARDNKNNIFLNDIYFRSNIDPMHRLIFVGKSNQNKFETCSWQFGDQLNSFKSLVDLLQVDSSTEVGFYGRIMFYDRILFLIKNGQCYVENAKKEKIGDSDCYIFDFVSYIDEQKKQELFRDRFWVDLNCSAQVRKYELYTKKQLRWRAFQIVLKKFSDKDGHYFWLPASGVVESFNFENEMVTREKVGILLESVIINDKSINDNYFKIKYPSRSIITDRVKKMQYEFGQTRTPSSKRITRSEAKELLEKQLELADQQGKELKAASWLRSGPGLATWVPWALASISLLAAGYAFWRRRGA